MKQNQIQSFKMFYESDILNFEKLWLWYSASVIPHKIEVVIKRFCNNFNVVNYLIHISQNLSAIMNFCLFYKKEFVTKQEKKINS